MAEFDFTPLSREEKDGLRRKEGLLLGTDQFLVRRIQGKGPSLAVYVAIAIAIGVGGGLCAYLLVK